MLVNVLFLVLIVLFAFMMLRSSSRSESTSNSSEPWTTPRQEAEKERTERRYKQSLIQQENMHQKCYAETCRLAAQVERMQSRSLFAEPPSYPALSPGDDVIDADVTDVAGLLS